MRLETKLDSLLPDWESFDITFYELIRDSEGGWSVNNAWTPFKNVDRAGAIEALKQRWEIFKLNYMSKARVSDLQDTSDFDDNCDLEVNCTAFAKLTKSE